MDDDPSILKRVIREPETGQEIIVSGRADTTFREALRRGWAFRGLSEDSEWIVVDDRGNDISDRPLSEYDGIAEIAFWTGDRYVSQQQAAAASDDSDDLSRYSTIRDSVEFGE